MANVKITELTAATALAGTDVLPIVDVGADATKKVSVSDLLRNLPDGTASAPALAFADDQNSGILSPAENELAFATSGTQRLVIDSSGRLGVGSSSFSTGELVKFYQGSSGSTSTTNGLNGVVLERNSDTGLVILTPGANNGSIAFGDDANASIGRIRYLHSSDAMIFQTNGGERLRIDSSGRLLVGTSTDASPFSWGLGAQIGGTSTNAGLSIRRDQNSSGGALLMFSKSRGSLNGNTVVQNGDQIGGIYFNGADGTDTNNIAAQIAGEVDGTPGSNDMPGRLVFKTTADGANSSTERMRIASDGNVYIGATGSIFNSTGVQINPNGQAQLSRSGSYPLLLNRQGSDGTLVEIRRSWSTVGSISVTSSATAYNTSSDYRLKENVVDLDGAITRVKQLAPKRFNFIADDTTTVDGFLAHEAQAVVPEAVTGTHNEVDDDGNAVMQGIDQSKLVPLLTAALQEAIAKIETLETKVAALEAQ
mgnify:CR=1 FL=1